MAVGLRDRTVKAEGVIEMGRAELLAHRPL